MPLNHTVAVKSETETTFTLAGWAVIYDDPQDDGADLVGDFFTKSTDLWLDKLGPIRPLLYDHGQTKHVGKRVIGSAKLDPLDDGVFFEAEIEKSTKYAAQIRALAEKGLLGASTGAISHLVEREEVAGKSWLKSWPTAELSLSVRPCEPRTLGVEELKALSKSFQDAGVDTADLKAMGVDVPQKPDPKRRQIKATSFEDLRTQIATALAANPDVIPEAAEDAEPDPPPMPMAVLGDDDTGDDLEQPDPTYVVATYPGYVVVERIDTDNDGDGGYWQIAYTSNDDGTVSLGEAVRVEQTYTPIGKSFTGAIAPRTRVEAPEPAVEIPHVGDKPTAQAQTSEPVTVTAPVVAETVQTTTTTPVAVVPATVVTTTTESTAIKSLEDKFDTLMRALINEPAVKAGGVAVPEMPYLNLKSDSSDEIKAFESFIRGGSPRGLKRSEFAGKAALNEGTAGQGGYAVPVQYSMDLIVPLTNLSYLRHAGARIVNFSGTDAVHVPSLTYTSAAVLTSEAASYSEIEPTLGEVVFTPYKFTRLAKVSEELAADSRFDLWGQILMPDWAQAFAQTENTYFTTGSGSAQPGGIVTGATTGVTTASNAAATADEWISTFFALDYKYRSNAKWMMNDATIANVRKLKDSQNRYLWEPGLNGNTQGLFLGKEIITNNSMAVIGTLADIAVFADFSYYWIGQWPGLDVQVLRELYAANGQVGYRGFRRFDAHFMLSAAATKLTCHV